MRRLFLLFSVSIFAFLAGAVTRQWDEGPLTWSDFKGEPSLKTSTSYLKGVLKTETEIEQQSKSKFKTDYRYATSAVALMDCSASYSDSAYRQIKCFVTTNCSSICLKWSGADSNQI